MQSSPAADQADDHESLKAKQHTIYCVLHEMENSVGKYYETLQVAR